MGKHTRRRGPAARPVGRRTLTRQQGALVALEALRGGLARHLADLERQRDAVVRELRATFGPDWPRYSDHAKGADVVWRPVTIPGLSAPALAAMLRHHGFRCLGPDPAQDRIVWTCDRGTPDGSLDYRVTICAMDASRVTLVHAGVLIYAATPGDELAADFLAAMAPLPYADADPARARAWVLANLGGCRETTIGSATFRLGGTVTTRRLEIVALAGS